MNLWSIFPEFILRVNGILYLPYLAIPFFIYVCYVMVKHVRERVYLIVFVLLTLLASGIMLISMGPQIGKVIPPLALLAVMVMPLVILTLKLYHKAYGEAQTWFVVTLAGWLHSMSWSVWLFVLAGS